MTGIESGKDVYKMAEQEMGCKLDKNHPYFRERALKAMSEQQLAGDLVDKEELAIPKQANTSQVRLLA